MCVVAATTRAGTETEHICPYVYAIISPLVVCANVSHAETDFPISAQRYMYTIYVRIHLLAGFRVSVRECALCVHNIQIAVMKLIIIQLINDFEHVICWPRVRELVCEYLEATQGIIGNCALGRAGVRAAARVCIIMKASRTRLIRSQLIICRSSVS